MPAMQVRKRQENLVLSIKNQMNNEPKNTGFSLTEVLLAVGILAVGMIFIASAFPAGIYFTTVAAERSIAAGFMHSIALQSGGTVFRKEVYVLLVYVQNCKKFIFRKKPERLS